MQRMISEGPGASPEYVAGMGYAYGMAGREAEARAELHRLLTMTEQQFVPHVDIAVVYIGLGESDDAIAQLEMAVEDHEFWAGMLRVDPRFDRLRQEPRFQDLVNRLGFPD